ncbi:SRPBCC family protein [Promicromonospora citrea]|uniref:Activator of HSP90 ATPase n=1 Tax=Promicromonospora citrea TaxID=43677 RepID=A0A8H9GPP4_9MICO|nr:SRPBCC family protein [Promicromonospora citrea]NNH54422.1 SRPBCC family protein [Promicromonospora citrea]GGM42096.1 activator of HSP90 ATPase [Promicromonospora citrea]
MTSTIDPVATAGLVTREVRDGERDGTPTKIAVARRTYAADRDDLWDALTSAERLPRWFLPVSGDLTLGGRYQFEGQAGGEIQRCDAPESFAATWEFGGQVSWVQVALTPADGGTTLELVHEALVDPDFWTQYGPGAVGVGWDLALLGLGLHLATRSDNDAREFEQWTLSPDGVEFVRAASTDWADAAAASGQDPAEARAAGERTLAFYTTVPES